MHDSNVASRFLRALTFVVEIADYSVAQRCANLFIFFRVLDARFSIQYLPRCAGLDLSSYEERHHQVVKEHCLCRESLPGKFSHLRHRSQ